MKKLLLAGLAASIAFAWYGTNDDWHMPPSSAPDVPEAAVPEERDLYVFVTGAVRKPGLYGFSKAVRVADAIHEAGDPVAYADMSAVNYAEVIQDGMHIHIPYNLEGTPTVNEPGKVNINEADEKQLADLPGIGPSIAKAIIAYRQAHGPFASLEELRKIKGIGQAKFDKMKDRLNV